MDALTRTWLSLIALTFGTAALAMFDGRLAVAGLLALAWCKARAILGGFLHLARAPGWLSAFTVPLAVWMLLLWAAQALAVR